MSRGKGLRVASPASVMGLSQEVAEGVLPLFEKFFVAGIGSTLSGNALAVAALRANLEHVDDRRGLRANDVSR